MQEKLRLQATTVCVVWAWPITLKLEVSEVFIGNSVQTVTMHNNISVECISVCLMLKWIFSS